MYDNLRMKIHQAITAYTPDVVLFSGGIDSSVIAYETSLVNQDFTAVTVGVDKYNNSDVEYSVQIAKSLNINNHLIKMVSREDILENVTKAIIIMKTFNPQWISSTVTLLLSIEPFSNQIYATGEGSDDLFGSFPFFMNWDNKQMPLETAIELRLSDISIMSERIFRSEHIQYILPYYDNEVKKEILRIPIQERTRRTKKYSSKYPLRKAYEGRLPSICLERPQTMAFTGSGIFKILEEIASDISEADYKYACSKYFEFSSKLEYYLFRIYTIYYSYEEDINIASKKKICIHCHADMDKKSVVCSKCNTFQINNKEIQFG